MLQTILTIVALLIISVTMLMRAKDLKWRKEWKWRVRLIGFVVAGFSPVGIILALLSGKDPAMYWCIFAVGNSMVYVTTPYLPPWWHWVWKGGPMPGHQTGEPELRPDRVSGLNRVRDENP